MRKRRVILGVLVAFFLAGITAILWTGLNWPPPKYLLKYGLTPGCEPTGQTMTVEGVEFVEIGRGIFRMGSNYGSGGSALGRFCASLGLPWGDQPTPTNEMPVHWVEFESGFWIARTELTNSQYEEFQPQHVREARDSDMSPVANVSWKEARAYCVWLSKKTDRTVRLPSEAEWECACRGGSNDEWSFGEDASKFGEHAWYQANSIPSALVVGKLLPNGYGLHDMHGNVLEWCEDIWHDSHEGAPSDGTARSQGNSRFRVGRGGSWMDETAEACVSSRRFKLNPRMRNFHIGFRPAFSSSE